jgi:hypothetical protein
MQPKPATSTTFSCQLSKTLMAVPVDSFAPPGRPPAWLKPVCCGVTLVGVRGALPGDGVDAMPLYLRSGKSCAPASLAWGWVVGSLPCLQVFHQDVQAFAPAGGGVESLEHGRHLACFDRLQDLDNGLEVGILVVVPCQYQTRGHGDAQAGTNLC